MNKFCPPTRWVALASVPIRLLWDQPTNDHDKGGGGEEGVGGINEIREIALKGRTSAVDPDTLNTQHREGKIRGYKKLYEYFHF